MRFVKLFCLCLILLLVSCAPQPAPAAPAFSTPTDTPVSSSITPAHEIRFALIGAPTDFNVWALFDEQGASYANYALRADYWPRLYHLSPSDLSFQPRAASGQPSPVTQEGEFFTSTVTLRPDLKWTDSLPFSAEDVAFTVNTALTFKLGLDWETWVAPDYLARAEALDAATVKFYFKQKPNVGAWQYGVLQAAVVQQAYWQPKITDARALLPDDALRASIADAQARITRLTPIVADLNYQHLLLQRDGKSNLELDRALKRNQGDLTQANNDLAKALAEVDARFQSARQALYALDNKGEPTLGTWTPSNKQNGAWVNVINPDFPFEKPNVKRAVYQTYASEEDAINALKTGDVDLIISPGGISSKASQTPASYTVTKNSTSSARFLVFSPARAELDDPALRGALACMIDNIELVNLLQEQNAAPLSGLVLGAPWQNPEAVFGCPGMDKTARLQTAVDLLKQSGYSWTQEPSADQAGQGLLLPGGAVFPPLTLLAPSEDDDPLRAAAAGYIEERAHQLGIPLTKKLVSAQAVLYAVYSARQFDAALLGWRLSLYPAYLCEWFGTQSPFSYNGGITKSACAALSSESDLNSARRRVFEIQSILAQDLPFIPLYTGVTYDAARGVHYPFEILLNGVSSFYGAPSYAIPSQ